MTGILDGIRIVEWAQWHAGPAGTCMLADIGAEVIKIERPKSGDESRNLSGPLARVENRIGKSSSTGFESSNRGKKSITLDLSKEAGRQIAYKLIQTADVFMQNFRGGVAEKMGMDYKTIFKYNPMIIYCNVNAYGPFGPDADKRGQDLGCLARSGMMTIPITENGEPPVFTGIVADHITSMVQAYAIATALIGQQRLGIGQEVDVSLLGSGVAVNYTRLYGHTLAGKRAAPAGSTEVNVYGQAVDGGEPVRQTRKTAINPIYNHYKCRDGKWLALANTAADVVWPDNCKALGIEHLQNDPRFNNRLKRQENNVELVRILDEVVATRTRAEWLEILKAYRRIMFAPLNDIEDLYTDPQVIENKYIVKQDHPTLGEIMVPGSPVNYRMTPAVIQGPAPELGEHNEALLTELGYSAADIQKFREEEII